MDAHEIKRTVFERTETGRSRSRNKNVIFTVVFNWYLAIFG
jgi:hypothetical protein